MILLLLKLKQILVLLELAVIQKHNKIFLQSRVELVIILLFSREKYNILQKDFHKTYGKQVQMNTDLFSNVSSVFLFSVHHYRCVYFMLKPPFSSVQRRETRCFYVYMRGTHRFSKVKAISIIQCVAAPALLTSNRTALGKLEIGGESCPISPRKQHTLPQVLHLRLCRILLI